MNIIITGGTRGLGLSHAFYLSNKGYNLALVDISSKACEVYDEIKNIDDLLVKLSTNGTKNKFYECDLTDFTSTEIIFLEFPSKPLVKEIVQLFNKAFFRIDGSKEGWEEEMLEILKMPYKKLLKLWADKKDAREELERHIFGPKGNSGKRAADYIAREIFQ